MIREYNQLPNKDKARIARAFFYIRTKADFEPFLNFLSICETESARNLRTLPLDQIAKEQGRAQAIADIRDLIDQATESEVWRLGNLATSEYQ